MSLVSFSEIKSSELQTHPITAGEILFTTDTNEIYHTSTDGVRRRMTSFSIVDTKPTAEEAIENHLYIVSGGFDEGIYIKKNGKIEKIASADTDIDITSVMKVSYDKPEDQIVGGLWFIEEIAQSEQGVL